MNKQKFEEFLNSGGGVCDYKVEKICKAPDSQFFFLDLDRMGQVGKQLKNFSGSMLSVKEFIDALYKGDYHIDSFEELKVALEKAKIHRDSFEVELKTAHIEIEQDMKNLCEKVISNIKDYFEELTKELQAIHLENNVAFRQSFETFEKQLQKKISGIEARPGGPESDRFNASCLSKKLKMMQKEPFQLENYLQNMVRRRAKYDIFKQGINIGDLDTFRKGWSDAASFDENVIKYVDNLQKLDSEVPSLQNTVEGTYKWRSAFDLPRRSLLSRNKTETVENEFLDGVVKLIDRTIGSIRHFSFDNVDKSRLPKGYRRGPKKYRTAGSKSPGRLTNSSAKKSLNSDSSTLKDTINIEKSFQESPKKGSTTSKQAKRGWPSSALVLKGMVEVQDFLADTSLVDKEVKFGVVEMEGTQWTKSGYLDIAKAIDSMSNLDRLVLSLSEIFNPGSTRLEELFQAIECKSTLRYLDLGFSGCKLNRQEILILDEYINKMHSLKGLSFCLDR